MLIGIQTSCAFTEIGKLALHLLAGEMRPGHVEGSCQLQSIHDVLRSRRQVQIRVEGERTGHHRRIPLDTETQHVVNPPVVDLDVHLDRSALDALRADDRAPAVSAVFRKEA